MAFKGGGYGESTATTFTLTSVSPFHLVFTPLEMLAQTRGEVGLEGELKLRVLNLGNRTVNITWFIYALELAQNKTTLNLTLKPGDKALIRIQYRSERQHLIGGYGVLMEGALLNSQGGKVAVFKTYISLRPPR